MFWLTSAEPSRVRLPEEGNAALPQAGPPVAAYVGRVGVSRARTVLVVVIDVSALMRAVLKVRVMIDLRSTSAPPLLL